MHHAPESATLTAATPEQFQHRNRRIAAVNDHREVHLFGEVQLRHQLGKLLVQVAGAVKVKAEFADGDDTVISHDRLPQHGWCVRVPVPRVEGVDTHRITEFGIAIGEGADGGNLAWLDAGMQQQSDPGLPPAGSDHIEVILELPEDQVAVTVDQKGRLESHGSGTAVTWKRVDDSLMGQAPGVTAVGSITRRTAALSLDF
jgi:hypothetical protein